MHTELVFLSLPDHTFQHDITHLSSPVTYHSVLNSGSLNTKLAILAPLTGGLEYIGLIKILICDSTAAFSFGLLATSENAPTRSPYRPMFFANDWHRMIWCPSDANLRTA